MMGVVGAYVVFPWTEWAMLVLPIVGAILAHAFIIRPRKKH